MNTIKTVFILTLTLVSVVLGGPDKPAKPANTGAVSGCLTDAETGQPIVDAWVAVLENNQGARTDSAGCFEIKNLKPGTYNLIVTHENYGTVQGLADLVVKVEVGQATQISFTLTDKFKNEAAKLKEDQSYLDRISDWFGVGRDREEISQSATPSISDGYSSIVPVPSGVGDNRSDQKHGRQGRVKRQPGGYHYPSENDYLWPPRDMFFKDYGTNGFTDARIDRFSTFATPSLQRITILLWPLTNC